MSASPLPPLPTADVLFSGHKELGHDWITLAQGEYYPDNLSAACDLYSPFLKRFGELLILATNSKDLFIKIMNESPTSRVQLARIFRKYVSPETPVEMLKKKSAAQDICDRFGNGFKPLDAVRTAFKTRPLRDEAICSVLWEYKDRGKKGYDLTETLFGLLKAQFSTLTVAGPERAGKDVLMGAVFADYPRPTRPVDFVIYDGKEVLAIGLARYDSDRGGAQEDDRTGGYRDCASELIGYADSKGLKTKVIFLNDGPGLLLGSMWNDYANLESLWPGRVRVVMLKMIPTRLSLAWLKS